MWVSVRLDFDYKPIHFSINVKPVSAVECPVAAPPELSRYCLTFSKCFKYFEKIKNEFAGSISLYQNAATKNKAYRTATVLRTVKLN